MSERIKNYKIFIGTLVGMLAIGSVVLIANIKNGSDINLKKYENNVDNYNYDIVADYSSLNSTQVLAGEEVLLDEQEHNLYRKALPLSLLKKINRLAYTKEGIKEADEFYEVKYSEKIAISNEYSMYKAVKTQLLNEIIKESLNEKKYLTTSNVFLLDSKDGFDYLKEVIYFVDSTTYEVVEIFEINSKYNHKEDKVSYASGKQYNDETTKDINNLLSDSLNLYNEVNSKKENISRELEEKYKGNIEKMYIFNRNTVLVDIQDKKEPVIYEYNTK